ncbi:unnamed protein product [Psylliodes chrysocephalus]|uniref:CUB domain-containing protein n=1 Tax=Psylliodes chrysocephalus TaxID=3402493 RepID=A0A9P0D7S0_9CUCU|nr:unnamed protein product [Psylliodes chrysocephala]
MKKDDLGHGVSGYVNDKESQENSKVLPVGDYSGQVISADGTAWQAYSPSSYTGQILSVTDYTGQVISETRFPGQNCQVQGVPCKLTQGQSIQGLGIQGQGIQGQGIQGQGQVIQLQAVPFARCTIVAKLVELTKTLVVPWIGNYVKNYFLGISEDEPSQDYLPSSNMEKNNLEHGVSGYVNDIQSQGYSKNLPVGDYSGQVISSKDIASQAQSASSNTGQMLSVKDYTAQYDPGQVLAGQGFAVQNCQERGVPCYLTQGQTIQGPGIQGQGIQLQGIQVQGIQGQGIQGQGIQGQGIQGLGIQGQGIQGQGIQGPNIQGQGIQGQGIQGPGIQGPGIQGPNIQGQGIQGQGIQGQGIQGQGIQGQGIQGQGIQGQGIQGQGIQGQDIQGQGIQGQGIQEQDCSQQRTAESLSQLFITHLEEIGLGKLPIVAQAYDGASVMLGTKASNRNQSFTLSGNSNNRVPAMVGSTGNSNFCQSDYLIIPMASNVGRAATGPSATVDRICGGILAADVSFMPTTVRSNVRPFNMYFHADGMEAPNDVDNRGFCLNYIQVPCANAFT